MTSKSQRKLDRQRKKLNIEQKRRDELAARQREYQIASETVGNNTRHRLRVSQQTPRAWSGEMAEDAAMFDESALSELAADLVAQVLAVRGALQDALESRGDEALKRLSDIPRTSPLSEWRLFVRGLVSWLANEVTASNEAWQRLDPARRPGRIAAVMAGSRRSDLDQHASPPKPQAEDLPDATPPQLGSVLDSQQLYHAKLLRRVRFDRVALRVAEAGLNIREESKDLHLGPKKMHGRSSAAARR